MNNFINLSKTVPLMLFVNSDFRRIARAGILDKCYLVAAFILLFAYSIAVICQSDYFKYRCRIIFFIVFFQLSFFISFIIFVSFYSFIISLIIKKTKRQNYNLHNRHTNNINIYIFLYIYLYIKML